MSKQMEYRKQIEVIENQLTKENKEYMGRINGYMMIASVFHRQEEAVTAQLLSIYQDVLEAQKTGFLRRIFGQGQQANGRRPTQLPPSDWFLGSRKPEWPHAHHLPRRPMADGFCRDRHHFAQLAGLGV